MLIGDVWISPPMIADISEVTGVNRTTVARWMKRRQLPPTVYRYLPTLPEILRFYTASARSGQSTVDPFVIIADRNQCKS